MKVHRLDVTVYDERGWRWRTETSLDPLWADIEAAIRRLDRFRYPFIWLFRNAEVELYTPLEFNVVGGDGEFAMDSTADGAYQRYYDESRGNEEIAIWRSDQGATFEAKYCCSSLDTVLRATHYFCDHGALDPGVVWQSQPW